MFAIYSSSGRVFSGPLEKLRRVERSATPDPSRQTAMAEAELTGIELQANIDGYDPSQQASKQSVQQYKQLLQDEGQRDAAYHAHQVMTPSVQVLRSTWSIKKAITAFKNHSFQIFPIVDDFNHLVGILSRRQLYEFLLIDGVAVVDSDRTIADCFLDQNSRVYSAEPVTDIRRIATLLIEKKLDALPIADDTGRILGIVSRTDILKCAIADPPLSLWC